MLIVGKKGREEGTGRRDGKEGEAKELGAKGSGERARMCHRAEGPRATACFR